MTLPQALTQQIEEKLSRQVASTAAVSGGCISQTARVNLANGERAFVKWSPAREHVGGLFREEARSLDAIADTRTVRVPHVLAVVDDGADPAFLLLEWLEPGRATNEGWRTLGAALAHLHQHRNAQYGWSSDNFIGSLPQSNRSHASWPEFWRRERLRPQLERAGDRFNAKDRQRLQRLSEHCEEILGAAELEGASLLHGDLWNGNVHMLADGASAVLDPSSYYGHREVDLAMSRLFGGFADEFYEAYNDAWPCQAGAEKRLLLYQLYYLLVHVNLFGGSYVGGTMSVVSQLGF